MTFGFSRDDAGKFLGAYYDHKIYENDPFAKLDQAGVGKLIEMACELGTFHPSRPQAGHLRRARRRSRASVEFCHKAGLDLRLLLPLPRAHRSDWLPHRQLSRTPASKSSVIHHWI